jgi:hypothetical protein
MKDFLSLIRLGSEVILLTLFCLLGLGKFYPSQGGEWQNPKELIADPWIARLQQGQKELTPGERDDLARYGYTGLELMTYANTHLYPGTEDNDSVCRFIRVGAHGLISIKTWLWRNKFYYRTYKSLLTYEGIKPGDVRMKRIVIYLGPPNERDLGVIAYKLLTSKEYTTPEDVWLWSPSLRKVRRYPSRPKYDNFIGSEITRDDFIQYEPWEEYHRIIGEDKIDGQECFVVESINRDPNYYLGKRWSWIEKTNFLTLHEEQFDRQGKLWKVIRNRWRQIKPQNFWVREEGDYYNVITHARTIIQQYDWIFDQGIKDDFFEPRQMMKEYHWRTPSPGAIPPINDASDLPAKPSSRSSILAVKIHK